MLHYGGHRTSPIVPKPKEFYHQLCLNLGETPILTGGKTTRSIPPIVKEMFELSDTALSGLVWKIPAMKGKRKAGDPAGSPHTSGKYFMVNVKGHGVFYAHRIAYYLKHGDDPGSMIVRHINEDTLVVGYQDDNMRDQTGKVYGNQCRRSFRYRGDIYNVSSLCNHFGINYHRFTYQLRKDQNIERVLRFFNLTEVTLIE